MTSNQPPGPDAREKKWLSHGSHGLEFKDVVQQSADLIRTIPDDGNRKRSVLRPSAKYQSLVARIGTALGHRIWIPRADRWHVQKEWTNANPIDEGELQHHASLVDAFSIRALRYLDVIWIGERGIVAAFEVEHTTKVYSGILRLADLVALQPNLKIPYYVVAAPCKRWKTFRELTRPTFAQAGSGALQKMVKFLAYDTLEAISDNPELRHMRADVLESRAEAFDSTWVDRYDGYGCGKHCKYHNPQIPPPPRAGDTLQGLS